MADFDLTMDELRVVARFAAESAEEALPDFLSAHPRDDRPRLALDAAWAFVRGDPRSNRQRVTALEAHRAAKDAVTPAARHAAMAAGDAAASAYLHPLAKATQVGHILRATAHAARAAELRPGGDAAACSAVLEGALRRASPTLVDVLARYPRAPAGKRGVAELMARLDASLRAPRDPVE